MPIWLLAALQAASPVDLRAADIARIGVAPAQSRCGDRSADGEVLVCGRRRGAFRLPLPVEREPTARVRGEAPGGAALLAGSGRCGLFAGERRCSKREAAAYGYGEGRDPITVAAKLVGKALHPDD